MNSSGFWMLSWTMTEKIRWALKPLGFQADGGDAGAGLWLALSHYMLGDYAAAAARLVDLTAADDVLFLYSTGVLNHSETIKG